MLDEEFMLEALEEAKNAYRKKEVPVGAVAVLGDKIIARAHNEREDLADPTAHAEILCIKRASKKLRRWRLNDVTLYSTLEPCSMCAGAMVHARIHRLVFGAKDLKAGACGSALDVIDLGLLNHRVKVSSGVLKDESEKILNDFFKNIRKGGELKWQRRKRKRKRVGTGVSKRIGQF